MTVTKFPGRKMSPRVAEARSNCIDIPELIGLCRGVLADGTITATEAAFILKWMQERPEVIKTWPANELHALLEKVLGDGALSAAEEKELTELLEEVIGDPVALVLY